jgi:ATP-binding cassette subfamily B protein
MGYALAHRVTPIRRELDYLLLLGSSRDSAKEVKVFGLADHLERRYAAASADLVKMNRALLRRRLLWGALFAVLGSVGYYGSYIYLVWRALGAPSRSGR